MTKRQNDCFKSQCIRASDFLKGVYWPRCSREHARNKEAQSLVFKLGNYGKGRKEKKKESSDSGKG